MSETEKKMTDAEFMNEVGTRYEHLSQYRDDLQACADLILNRGIKSLPDQQRYAKFAVAATVITETLDTLSGYRGAGVDYSLYKLLNGVPRTAEQKAALGMLPIEETK